MSTHFQHKEYLITMSVTRISIIYESFILASVFFCYLKVPHYYFVSNINCHKLLSSLYLAFDDIFKVAFLLLEHLFILKLLPKIYQTTEQTVDGREWKRRRIFFSCLFCFSFHTTFYLSKLDNFFYVNCLGQFIDHGFVFHTKTSTLALRI